MCENSLAMQFVNIRCSKSEKSLVRYRNTSEMEIDIVVSLTLVLTAASGR